MLAGTITMTPARVSADLVADGRALLVHGLDVPDPDALVAEIKSRYEAPPVGDLPMIQVAVGDRASSRSALAMLLNLYRLALGPDIVDRVLALDTLVINAIALIVLLGIALGTDMYFEAALLIAMLGFVSHRRLLQVPAARRRDRVGPSHDRFPDRARRRRC